MTTAKFVQPNFTDATQTASIYKGNIDASVSVVGQIGQQFAPHAQDTPAMTVLVDAGRIIKADGTLVSQAQQTTPAFTAPTANPRIDRIVIDQVTGAISVIAGTEAASPVAPAITAGNLPCAQVLLQTTSTAITNAMITDERTFVLSPAAAYTASGTDTYTATGLVANTGYDSHVTFTNANTSTAPTLNGTTIVKEGSAALVAGDIPAGHAGILRYNGTNFVLMNPKNAFRGCLVFFAADQTIVNITTTSVSFTSSTYDTSTIHNNVTNPSRLTVPSGVTRVLINAQVVWATNGTGIRQASIYRNGVEGTTGSPKGDIGAPSATNQSSAGMTSAVLNVTAGDYFELFVFQNSGGSLNLLANYTWMSMEIVE